MYGQGRALGEYVFVPPTSGRALVEPSNARQQFSLRLRDPKEGDVEDLLEVKYVVCSSEPSLEAISPQTKEALSLRAKMTCNHSYCQRSFNPARESGDVKSLGFDRFVALTA
jgi:hypothetical protein